MNSWTDTIQILGEGFWEDNRQRIQAFHSFKVNHQGPGFAAFQFVFNVK